MQRTNPDTSFIEPYTQKSTFLLEGVALAATLYTPECSTRTPLPAILMVGGWGSVQRALTYPFVCHFVQAGFAVMEFDFQGWGMSAGWPRQNINPWQRVKAASTALAHLKAQTEVDASQVFLWGTSFGGGHVVDLAVLHPDVQGVIAQVPMLDGMAAVKAVPILRLLKFSAYFMAGLVKPGYALTLPTLGAKGDFATMDRDGAWDAMQLGLGAIKEAKYVNLVTSGSLLYMGFYRPVTQLKNVQVPMLLVGAVNDSVAPYVAKKIASVNNPNIQTVEINANHFDPYFEPVFSSNIKAQLAFLQERLRNIS